MRFKKIYHIILIIILPNTICSQNDTLRKFSFNADFRFRIEQDYNSEKSDGSLREDRTRLRYRARAGFVYNYKDWATFGSTIRTGNPIKQQDPQLTLGDDFSEFNILPIGFEKIYFKAEQEGYAFWVGKNTFPFDKQNELFWSDNVYPEGLFFKKKFQIESEFINKLNLSAGHFIIRTNGTSLDKDSYFQGFQVSSSVLDRCVNIYSSLYLFKNIPDIPDGADTYVFDYSILNIGSHTNLIKSLNFYLELDYYKNLMDYDNNKLIAENLKDEKSGFVAAINYGALIKKTDWKFKATYSYLERFAAIDFLAQNDWARWDYSSFGSPDGRLTNFKGIELVASYLIDKNISLTLKYYKVDQLVAYGAYKENGDRVRLDLDIKF